MSLLEGFWLEFCMVIQVPLFFIFVVLQLGYNQLVGNIPKQMGSLKQLNALALQHNKLTGQVPLSLGNLEKLRRLNLSFNNFNGMVPATLANIAHLEVLDIQNNSLSGTVPSGMPLSFLLYSKIHLMI